MVFTYLTLGENLTQGIQYASYWVAACSVYGISRKVGHSPAQALFTALSGLLLINWLMESTTTQNDLIITAYVGIAVYGILAFYRSADQRYLIMTAVSSGLAVGTKATAVLALIPASMVFIPVVLHHLKSKSALYKVILSSKIFATFTLSIVIFALPAGYIDNMAIFDHPTGPEEVRKSHSFEDQSFSVVVKEGIKNSLRFSFDFVHLDGLPPITPVKKIDSMIVFVPVKLLNLININLEDNNNTRSSFKFNRSTIGSEDSSYWGILGFGLIWISISISIVNMKQDLVLFLLSMSFILFFLVQAFIGPYDPWRGRYFTMAAIFALPSLGLYLNVRNLIAKVYVLSIVIGACVSALSGVFMRANSMPLTLKYQNYNYQSIFTMSRIEQLTRKRPTTTQIFTKIEEIVPQNATLAVFHAEDRYEYPLFGENLRRVIVPIRSFWGDLQDIPPDAQFLLYIDNFPCSDKQNDVHLGLDYYLRDLSTTRDMTNHCLRMHQKKLR